MKGTERENIPGQETAHGGSVQGEGDYRAAQAYRDEVETYLEHADVAKAAREAAPRNLREARELEEAEEEGRSHAKDQSLAADMRRTNLSLKAVQDAIRERPVMSMILTAVTGYLIGRIRQRS